MANALPPRRRPRPVAVVAVLLAASLALSLVLSAGPARAQDAATPSSGFYVGGHAGYLFGTANATLADPTGGVASAGGASSFGGQFGGVQAGWERHFASRLMLGVEADLSFTDYADNYQVLAYRATPGGSANAQLEYLGTLRGRVGWDLGGFTPFLTGGLAFASMRYSRTDSTTGNEDATPGQWRFGWTVGGGIDRALDRHWSARLEYLYTSLGPSGWGFAAPARLDSQFDVHRFRVGLNYRFAGPQDGKAEGGGEEGRDDPRGPGTWEIHGQSTFIFQGYPPFAAAYDGPSSLPSGGQSRQTWTVSAYLGVRLWQGGEFYYNPELLQGYGVNDTFGAAGFPNGEAQKSSYPFPRFNSSRVFLRQEFGQGGAREKVESDYGQLSGEKDVDRVTLQVGKFAVKDLFDTNDYAGDPRLDFMNWSIWAAGAFDYPADRLGLTWGLAAELNRALWAVRGGYFLVGNAPNANVFDMDLFARGGYLGELELRPRPFGRPGVAKFGAWFTSTFAGSYADAVALAGATGMTVDDAVVATRRGRIKSGLYLNLQQEVSDDVGAFLRWSWNDGRSEIAAFTDIDQSLSGGVQVKGASWRRPDDRIGIAAAWNAISAAHRDFLAAGGTGLLVGDGQLTYSPEVVVETYYAVQLTAGFVATVDYQLLANPGYNAVRGPVHVLGGRLRASF
jgi:high affinity Mn2+ porin